MVVLERGSGSADVNPRLSTEPARAGIVDQPHAGADAVVLDQARACSDIVHDVRCRQEKHIAEIVSVHTARMRIRGGEGVRRSGTGERRERHHGWLSSDRTRRGAGYSPGSSRLPAAVGAAGVGGQEINTLSPGKRRFKCDWKVDRQI